jgi:hypothetical protein
VEEALQYRGGGADRFARNGLRGLRGPRTRPLIPPIFDDYATVVIPSGEVQQQHDDDVIALLAQQSSDEPWWLGYLDRGGSDVVFPGAPRTRLYANWPYVLVQAGPEQAARWRKRSSRYRLPEIMFPASRSWLASTLWDDDWTCVGGSASLIDSFLDHRVLKSRVRRVGLNEDATPPGHEAR